MYLKKLKIKDLELENNLILAPMAGVTDLPFRKICKEFGPGLVCTEMVSSKAIYHDDTKRYKLSRKLLTLGFRSLNEHNLLETVLPRLRDLRDEVQETSCFGVLGEKNGIFIEQAQGNHTFRFVLSPGKPFELHCSAPGKAIMAYLPNNVRDRYLSYMEFTRYNDRTITSPEEYLKESLTSSL